MNYHSVDIQWGNHDMIWMGAAAGSRVCIANVLRIAARYSNLDIIEDIYGINLLPLATFALKYYSKDDCKNFIPKTIDKNNYSSSEINLIAKMHKAITIIQFKLEYEVIKRNPEFNMESRLMLDFIDFENNTIRIYGKVYKMNDSEFPTVSKKKPYELNEDEKNLICKLESSFRNSEKLQRHINFLFEKGSIYLEYNGNLLFHGCIPLNEDKTFKAMKIKGKEYSGRKLLEKFESLARTGYFSKRNTKEKEFGMDMMWYLWTGSNSSLFGKEAMTTFERYFIDDKSSHKEKKNPYYRFRDDEEMCNNLLKEFEVKAKDGRIINGHVPVKNLKGENPVKANGKLIVIDGGFSREYRSDTGIAGYTLISSSYNLKLIAHEPFTSTEEAIVKEKDILSTITIVDKESERKRVKDTDAGKELIGQIIDLKMLLEAYRKGLIKQKN
jgi:fructose-1,6-bisphosphatase III